MSEITENVSIIDDNEFRFPADEHYYAEYYIDSFRSLHDFSIRLEEGINVFVGPNGSGKTNFIDFLDFLSVYLQRGAAAAVSHLGGLARVFSQETLKSKRPRVKAKVCGLADLGAFVDKSEERRLFRFEYEIDIRFSKLHSSLFVAGESVKFKCAFWDDLAVFADKTVGTIGIKRKSPLPDMAPTWEVGTRLLTRGPRNPMRFQKRAGRLSFSNNLKESILEPPQLAPDESLLSARPSWPAFDAVRLALSRGRSFNLNPSSARSPDDLSRPPIISPDGSGLSATLYQMHQARRQERRPVGLQRLAPDALDTVVTWTKLVFPELKDITAVADPQTGKYLAYLIVETDDHSLKIPLQSASDGTLKWLSFVCLINSRWGVYSLEEPENFLHPKMQSFLIDLIRDNLHDDHPGYFILTTHSESIINQCKPEEILLFEFKNGKTAARRLQNPDAVRAQINATGFGLGHYYAYNAIS